MATAEAPRILSELAQRSLVTISDERSKISQKKLDSAEAIRGAIVAQVAPIVDKLPHQYLPVSSWAYNGLFGHDTYVTTVKYDPRENELVADEYQVQQSRDYPRYIGGWHNANLREARHMKSWKLNITEWLVYAEAVVSVIELAKEAVDSGLEINDEIAKKWLDQLNEEAEARKKEELKRRYFPELLERNQNGQNSR